MRNDIWYVISHYLLVYKSFVLLHEKHKYFIITQSSLKITICTMTNPKCGQFYVTCTACILCVYLMEEITFCFMVPVEIHFAFIQFLILSNTKTLTHIIQHNLLNLHLMFCITIYYYLQYVKIVIYTNAYSNKINYLIQ